MKEKSNVLRYNIHFRLQKIYLDANMISKISMSKLLKIMGIPGNWKDLPVKNLSSINSQIDQFLNKIKVLNKISKPQFKQEKSNEAEVNYY